MKKIGFIGLGMVGTAIKFHYMGMLAKDYKLVERDPKLGDASAAWQDFMDCAAVYVCLPTPATTDTGDCDVTVLESALHDLFAALGDSDTVVIAKSTAPPEFYVRMQQQYHRLVHCPEFLRARSATMDYMNSDYFVLGGDPTWTKRARDIISQGVFNRHVDYLETDIATAAFYKYMVNSYLATKVTFMNEFNRLAVAQGVEWFDVKRAAKLDRRIGDSHMDVPGPDGTYGWAGDCFPKDTRAIINVAQKLGVRLDQLMATVGINGQQRSGKIKR
jgi:nucleotide sugar dehydrogenase